MNVLNEAARQQAAHKAVVESFGKELESTFYSDFTIAELMGGAAAIRDTYKRAFAGWKDNAKMFAELVICLNHKIWQHHEKNAQLAELYNTLWEDADNWANDNYKGEDAEVYFNLTD